MNVKYVTNNETISRNGYTVATFFKTHGRDRKEIYNYSYYMSR